MSSYNYKEGLEMGGMGVKGGRTARQNSGPDGRAILKEGNSRGLKLLPAPHKGGRGERSTNKTISKRIAPKERSMKKKRVSMTDGSREAGKGGVLGRVSWLTCLFKR